MSARNAIITVFCLTCLCVGSFAEDDLPTPVSPTKPVSTTLQLPLPTVVPTVPPSKVDIPIHGDTVTGFRMQRLENQDKDASYPHPYAPVKDARVMELPAPLPSKMGPRHLSLDEAIAIALRNNPAVHVAELQRIVDKFGLETAIHDRYQFQWSPLVLGASKDTNGTSWQASEGVKYQGLTGGSIALGYQNGPNGGPGSGTVTLNQPLLQGAGLQYNRIIYDNAMDAEAVAKLNFKNNVMTVVISVITTYRALVEAYENLTISEQSLKSQEASVHETQLRVQVGQMAQSDYIQQKANLESTRLSVVQQENALRDSYQAFLTSLGLIPSANIQIDQEIHVGKTEETIPSKSDCITLALQNNIAYRSALIQLRNTERGLIQAKNTQEASLDVTGTYAVTSQNTSSQPSASTGLSLSVPIDNVGNQAAVVGAQVSIEDAKMNLEQQKENLVRQVTDQWEDIQNQYRQIQISKNAVAMQAKTLENTKLLLKYGRTTVFEVNTLETSLLQQQIQLVSTKIGYLNAVTALNQTLARTLDNRHVKLRY